MPFSGEGKFVALTNQKINIYTMSTETFFSLLKKRNIYLEVSLTRI